MAGRILKRCSVCMRFHASYLVDDPELGRLYLCSDCWHARQRALTPATPRTDVPSTVQPEQPRKPGTSKKR